MKHQEEIGYESWDEFKRDFCSDLFGMKHFQPNVCLFRGQREADWSLQSSFDRWYENTGLTQPRADVASKFLDLFHSELEHSGDTPSPPRRSNELMALAQHYGLPTRLLDWTDSPYVAAFFAFSRSSWAEEVRQGDIAIWALHLDAKIWNSDLGVEVVQVTGLGNPRLRNQIGAFTISRTPHSCLEDYVQQVNPPNRALTKLIIPRTEARAAMRDLAAMRITSSLLFPGVEGVARTAFASGLVTYELD